jgi:acyl-CoA synthetase (AMP-forming)/AMP-acid ligase II
MHGLMMDMPLLITQVIEHAQRHHGETEIVSRRVEGDIHRYTYADCNRRAKQLANALQANGISLGDRVATLAFNGYRHMELYYGVGGMGAVVHTINPRLHPDQIAWIINHAEDSAMFYDLPFAPIIQAIASKCPTVKHWIPLCDAGKEPIANSVGYEAFIAAHSNEFVWPQLPENTAVTLCYTSGTTGNPKGVLYSHRSTVLHAYAACLPDAMGLSSRDCILPVVPLFHVNAWGTPYSAMLVGAKIVFPGAALDGKSIYELFESEKVTLSLIHI